MVSNAIELSINSSPYRSAYNSLYPTFMSIPFLFLHCIRQNKDYYLTITNNLNNSETAISNPGSRLLTKKYECRAQLADEELDENNEKLDHKRKKLQMKQELSQESIQILDLLVKKHLGPSLASRMIISIQDTILPAISSLICDIIQLDVKIAQVENFQDKWEKCKMVLQLLHGLLGTFLLQLNAVRESNNGVIESGLEVRRMMDLIEWLLDVIQRVNKPFTHDVITFTDAGVQWSGYDRIVLSTFESIFCMITTTQSLSLTSDENLLGKNSIFYSILQVITTHLAPFIRNIAQNSIKGTESNELCLFCNSILTVPFGIGLKCHCSTCDISLDRCAFSGDIIDPNAVNGGNLYRCIICNRFGLIHSKSSDDTLLNCPYCNICMIKSV